MIDDWQGRSHPYIELHAHSHYSLLDGASSPEALVRQAAVLGMPALALTDHDNLYGAVRFWQAAIEQGIQAIIGAEVTLAGADTEGEQYHLTLLAENQTGYANLCRLLSHAHLSGNHVEALDFHQLVQDQENWPGKTKPRLSWETLNAHRQGLIALSGCRQGPLSGPILAGDREKALQHGQRLRYIFGPHHLYVELQRHFLPDEPPLLRTLQDIARHLSLPLVATNNVHYAQRHDHRLQDVMVCIHHLTSLDKAQGLLRPNSEYYLKSAAEMARLFPAQPQAIAHTRIIAERCQVELDFSHARLPSFPVPDDHTAFSFLYELCQKGLHRKYQPVTPAASKQLAYELDVIEQSGLAGYFLIVWDIVRFAQQQSIRYQGRGSAANSLVAYLLDITPVDPLRFNLLFDRFLSADSHTMPDIDIDFAADRREEVIHYVYHRYGVEHTAMVCNINTFQARSALRDVGRALGLQPQLLDQLQRTHRIGERLVGRDIMAPEEDEGQQPEIVTSMPPTSPQQLLFALCDQLTDKPRHLSIHVGGMIITGPPLQEIVPLERATMPGRVVVQWNKDSVEDAGLIKIDLLGLRTLGMVDEIAMHIATQSGRSLDFQALPLDDTRVYNAMSKGDTLGVFQIESRAQMQMLPRLRPRRFEDVVVEVAIIRPGPIQGNMVHPYLRRRQGIESVQYPHPLLEPVLAETLGVVLFQEQVLRVAMVMANFSGGEADRLRRTMSRQRSKEEMKQLGEMFITKAMANGVRRETAVEVFSQLAGFATYGFCKSHAAAFALLAYQTMWLKLYHPAAFYCALLNHQPMGFYTPAVVMGDARRHGIAVLPPDLNRSQDACILEDNAVRLGLRYVKGLGPTARQCLLDQRKTPFQSLSDLCHRTRLPRDSIEAMILAGALDTLEIERRHLLWELHTLHYTPHTFDLAFDLDLPPLPSLSERETMSWNIERLGMSPGDHPLRLYRPYLQTHGILAAADVNRSHDGDVIKVAGQVVIRQRPATAKGHLFITLEDETGLANLIVRPHLYEKHHDVLRHAPLIYAIGRLQRQNDVCSILVFHVQELH